jgi:tripartite-type tricarboxylate transporter receptor subunit TctC
MFAIVRLIVATVGAAALIVASAIASTLPAFAQANFYEGKTIRIVIALGTGGGYDSYARLVSRHLGKHIAGNPTVIVQNMPGAGGIIAANHIYNVAPKDGTVIGALHANLVLAQVTDTPNIEYDARKMIWVGRMVSGGLDIHHTWHTTGVTSFDDLLKREVVFGGGGPTSSSIVEASAINKMMGGKLKILGGYKGTADTTLALERGEIDMASKNWELIRVQHADWLKDKKINLIVQFGLQRHTELPNVPTILEVSKTEEQKAVWRLILSPIAIGYALSMAPGIPPDRVAILRKAFDEMMKDPEMKADAEKAKLDLDPATGEQLEQTVAAMFKADASSIAIAKSLLAP